MTYHSFPFSNPTSGASNGINFTNLADELELFKAVKHLRAREFDQAIETLKSFEKKDRLSYSSARMVMSDDGVMSRASMTPTLVDHRSSGGQATARVAATACTNLSFLYLLQQDYETAKRYADEAMQVNRYSMGALMNKGSVLYFNGDYEHALEHYREVLSNHSTSLEAYFNVALVEKKLGNYDRALDALFRLRSLTKIASKKKASSLERSTSDDDGHSVKSALQYNQKIINAIEIKILYLIGTM